jgi:hypothetical protein
MQDIRTAVFHEAKRLHSSIPLSPVLAFSHPRGYTFLLPYDVLYPVHALRGGWTLPA